MDAPAETLGGTDPIPIELPWARAHTGGQTQIVTATTELEWHEFSTNAQGFFSLDDSDPSAILVHEPGLYHVTADVYYNAADLSDIRAIYQSWGFLSAGVVFGNEMNPGIGTGQSASGISEVHATPAIVPKSRLSNLAIVSLLQSHDTLAADPFRLVTVLQHSGSNYTTSTAESTQTIIRIAGPPTFFDSF